ncbi:MAG: sigma 54-interacting transcriptional regulator [Spirochaetales bacterium]|nr:sigma 54-interacting transcriptional regulator [Spirochaetales bacterium]
MIEILVVVPYREVEEAYKHAINRIRVKEVNFTTILNIYGTDNRTLEALKPYDIVVVRGMTGLAVSKLYPEINKIDISITSSDVLDSILDVKNTYGPCKIGLILSDNTICSIEAIREISGFDIEAEYAEDEDGLEKKAMSLISRGCDVLVGGLTLKDLCQKIDFPYVQIKTGVWAVEKSIRDAIVAAQILDRERTKTSLLDSIIDNTSGCLFAVNTFGTVIASNQKANKFFSVDDMTGKSVTEFYPEGILSMTTLSGTKVEIVHNIAGKTMMVTQTPIIVSDGDVKATIVEMQTVDDIREKEKKVRSRLSEKGLTARYHFSDIIAEHLSMKQIIAKAVRYASVEGNVLITGETGTGKELFVQSMHNASPRSEGPFVAINCAALSEQLLESELFGYAEGSFTGASKGGKAGLFELAHGGTIFLDEIGEMPMQLQAKILRVLQENEVRRVGGHEVIPVDVRVMSATNKNIPELIAKGLFRRDLYYRINLLSLSIPPLRERINDIGLLFEHFVKRNAKRFNIMVPAIDNDAIAELQKYRWMGNIRELRNVAERIVVLTTESKITANTIKNADIPDSERLYQEEAPQPLFVSSINYKAMATEELYEAYLESRLSLSDFAKNSGISRTTLWRRFKKIES